MTSSTKPALTNFSALRLSGVSNTNPVVPTANDTFSVTDILQPGASITVDVYANTSTATSGSFRTQLTVASIGATSYIVSAGTSTNGQTITLATGTVATPTLVSASTTPAQYVASSVTSPATSGSQATFQFVSTSAPSTITELKFTVTGTDENPSQTVKRICVGSVCGSPADYSGTQQVHLTAGLNLVVNPGAGLTQNVLVDYTGVGQGGVIPGKTSTITLSYVKYQSGSTSAEINPNVAAPTMTLVGSLPTVAVNTTTVSGLNIGGVEQKIGEVTVTASSKGAVKINDIKFNVSNSGFTTNPTFTSARIADGSTTITGTSCGQGTAAQASQTIFCEFGTTGNTFASGTDVATVESNVDFDGYMIGAATSKTFNLYAVVSGENTGTNKATISTSVDAAGFNWDDTSYAVFASDGSSASPADGTNLTGSSIYNFPAGSYTASQ
jgi:hypothetical protein